MAASYWFFRRRKELKLTQSDLVERLHKNGFDFSQRTISAWETGRNNPPIQDTNFLEAFAAALELSIQEILELGEFGPEFSEARLRENIAKGLRYSVEDFSKNNVEIGYALMAILGRRDGDVKVIADFETLRRLRNLAVHEGIVPSLTLRIEIDLHEPLK